MGDFFFYRCGRARRVAAICVFLFVGWAHVSDLAAQNQNQGEVEAPIQSELRPPAAKGRGPCVLLKNQNVLFGKAVPSGGEIVVQRDQGSNLTLPRESVLHWGNHVGELYDFLSQQQIATSAREHLSRARWCIRYGLLAQAYQELQRGETIAPSHPHVQSVKRLLYRAVMDKRRQTASNSVPKSSAKPLRSDDKPQHVEPQQYDDATLRNFVLVQSTLVNRCGNCHRKSESALDVKWRLHLPQPGSRLSTRLTRENLMETLKYVSFETPMESLIRVRAIDEHAGSRYRLSKKDVVAIARLDHWVSFAKPIGSPLSLAKRTLRESEDSFSMDSTLPDRQPSDASSELSGSQSAPGTPPDQPKPVSRLPDVGNPFDPEIFNRRVHGK